MDEIVERSRDKPVKSQIILPNVPEQDTQDFRVVIQNMHDRPARSFYKQGLLHDTVADSLVMLSFTAVRK